MSKHILQTVGCHRSCICDVSIDFLGKCWRDEAQFGEDIQKNLFDQQPSPFRLDFQYFGVNSSLKWRRPHRVICL